MKEECRSLPENEKDQLGSFCDVSNKTYDSGLVRVMARHMEGSKPGQEVEPLRECS
jgi:hypothetical protein